MRGFLVLLALTNLLFLVYQHWFKPEAREGAAYGDIPIINEGFVLLSELEKSNRPLARQYESVVDSLVASPVAAAEKTAKDPTVEQGVAGDVAETDTICYQSSLLDTLDDARGLQQQLVLLGIRESERKTVETKKINYWVVFPAEKDPAKLEDAVGLLQKRRVKDFFVVRTGRYENAISLGVYSTRERAEQRYQEITALKLRLRKPVIEALELPAKRLVLSIRLEGDGHNEGLASLLTDGKQPYLRKITCN